MKVMVFMLMMMYSIYSISVNPIIEANTENFEDIISESDYLFVLFYKSPEKCETCKGTEFNFQETASRFKSEGSEIVFVKVDADANLDLTQNYGVYEYPTLYYFQDGEFLFFGGEKTTEGMYQYIKKRMGPYSKELENEKEEKEFTKKGGVIIGHFKNEKSRAYNNFLKVAKDEDDFLFGHRFTGKDEEKIFVITKENDEKTFTEKTTKKKIKAWIKREAYPALEKLEEKVWIRYSEIYRPLFTLFIDPKDHKSFEKTLQSLAKEFKGKIGITWMDSTAHEGFAERWGGSGKIPTAFYVTFVKGLGPKIIPWNEETEKELNTEVLMNFIKLSQENKYQRYKKSEAIPEKNDEPVKVVVAKTFDSIVKDTKKDVLVEFYAPWCQHCKALEPIYNELGKKLQGISTVSICKMDATKNYVDENYKVQGFPTILFFPAGDKDKFILYEDQRELSKMVSFVQQHATHKFVLPQEKIEKVDL